MQTSTNKSFQNNKNRDIAILLTCKPMLCEIRALREKDREEQNAFIGAARSDGMPRGGHSGGDGMADILIRAERIHKKRLWQIEEYEKQVRICEIILRKIPVKDRLIARLLYIDQMTVTQVARSAYVSERTVARIKHKMEERERF